MQVNLLINNLKNTAVAVFFIFYLFIGLFCDKMKALQRSLYMKKIINKINFALIAMVVSTSAFAAKAVGSNTIQVQTGMCDLITRLHGIFETLRILAFVGAAFYIAGWAWKYISSGDAKVEDLKKTGYRFVGRFRPVIHEWCFVLICVVCIWYGNDGMWRCFNKLVKFIFIEKPSGWTVFLSDDYRVIFFPESFSNIFYLFRGFFETRLK